MRAGNAYTKARAGFAGNAYMPANEMVNGTTWRRLYGAWPPEVDISRSGVYIYNFNARQHK